MNLEIIRKGLEPHKPLAHQAPGSNHQGAVAVILRPDGDETRVLLIRRAERAGDPWSGHMAFPGGHAESSDPTLFETVTRETREEIGVDLEAQGELIGQLDELEVFAYGRPIGMKVVPYVFVLRQECDYQLNSEVDEMVWGALGEMAKGEVDAVKAYSTDGVCFELPAYNVQGRIVWGLTYRILQDLFLKLGLSR
jgi:8-oxo-dGTP pyrophosphatase MutT (NUDIX family)